MASFLCKLGRFSFRRRWFVVALWAGLLVVAGVLASRAPAAPPNDFSMPGTEAQQASDLLEARFPEMHAGGASARVVFRAQTGKVTDPQSERAVRETVRALGADPQVAQATDPFRTGSVSKDGSTAYTQVSYEVSAANLADSSRTALLDTVEHARSPRLTVEAGGNAVSGTPGGGHSSEALGLAVAAVVLVLTFGSLLAAGLPLLTALLGVAIGASAIKALSAPLGLGTTTTGLATMIGLAVGIDYALFVVSRYRAELARTDRREDAAGYAVGTAGSAVVFAGTTVVIALLGLWVVGIPLLTQMGFAAAGTVVLAVLIAVTLIPALLGVAGRGIGPARPRRRPRRGPDGTAGAGLGVRWAGFVVRRPVVVLLTGVAALAAIAVPAASLEMGLSGDGSKPVSTTQRKAYDLVADGFGPGYDGPFTVVVQPHGGDARTAAGKAAHHIRALDDVAAVGKPRLSASGDTAVLSVVPASAPDSAETTGLLRALRDPALANDADARVLVGGTTAMNADVSQKLSDALLPYLALVVGLAFLLLIAVFRSVFVPLKAALGFLLSVLAGLGAVVAVFQWGWLSQVFGVDQPGPVMSMMPIFMVGVVFGLAMDYEVFLVTRMREAYVHGRGPLDAIRDGFRHSARVVTAAAVIMIAVFAAFMGSGEQMIKTIGFGLAVAVLFDAFVVRMALVPAVLSLLGDRAWRLPRRLDRLVPDFDVEGERLPRERTATEVPRSGDDRPALATGEAVEAGRHGAGG
ncbi:MMPL family transporter [Streptantibioticus cattleyicolor]|uniref:Transmembrane transport protein n=1 Tax=Streptantibioticus cattleyicolor (strain ATCC 35852 / DSM 46488 / JCM 4925 / NBRC 14057 / NRRL 8057) TaxID=1003195 RepID=F8JKJ6_STREN|nr:MMPL family transporter [Streptantibioticus cattleyicolor]AEW99734.1 transmembrane transport protein [Streptantibioticus cattleyicolor NRRL 8057 = DSM 46488]CCB71225.1 putative transmembrane transport protein [Streptantibioticus cattleyicolor NRRL 8057 = DSM 46488]